SPAPPCVGRPLPAPAATPAAPAPHADAHARARTGTTLLPTAARSPLLHPPLPNAARPADCRAPPLGAPAMSPVSALLKPAPPPRPAPGSRMRGHAGRRPPPHSLSGTT